MRIATWNVNPLLARQGDPSGHAPLILDIDR
jgi:hypothetical protein